jgi:hypothetical protein
VYHEHLVLDEIACRECSKENAHIFPTIIEAWAKEGIAMLKAKEGSF